MKRWNAAFDNQYLIKIESSHNKHHPWRGQSKPQAEKIFGATYPAIYERFRPLRQSLIDRSDQGKYFWELRACAYWQEFEQPKIIVPAITDGVNYAQDDRRYYSNDKTSIVIPPSMPYALAILNSPVSWWFTQQTFASKQGGFYEFKPMYFAQLPVPKPTGVQQTIVESVTQYLLWVKNNWFPSHMQLPPTQMLDYFEQLLNGLVYELFFPEELHARKLFLFDHVARVKLPTVESLPKSKRAAAVQEAFDRIYECDHPIRECLSSLGSLPIVRIIEGEREAETSLTIPLESTAERHSRRPRRSGVWSPDSLVPA